MTRPAITGISPFFIVSDMTATLSFYRDRLGFAVAFQEPLPDDFFPIVSCDRAGSSSIRIGSPALVDPEE